jgi:hypothetical protein
MCYKFVGNNVIDITEANHDTFKKENPNKPKMLLFTDKKSVPITYRALSTYFDVSSINILRCVTNFVRKHWSLEWWKKQKKVFLRSIKLTSSHNSSFKRPETQSSLNTLAQDIVTSSSLNSLISTQKLSSLATKRIKNLQKMPRLGHGCLCLSLIWAKTQLMTFVSRKMEHFA